ncbi:MAG TPA: hypothetical protein VF771_20005 [Longimicrobiaceae bacterium]
MAGSRLPDLLEPGTSSWHRKAFHSLVLLVGGGAATVQNSPEIAAYISGRRQALAQSRTQWQLLPATHPERIRLERAEVLEHFVIGALIGLAIGYALHLLMDAGTRRGLPVF